MLHKGAAPALKAPGRLTSKGLLLAHGQICPFEALAGEFFIGHLVTEYHLEVTCTDTEQARTA